MAKARQRQSYESRIVLGRRFTSARNLAEMTQVEAAKDLGYRNSSQLSKIETGTVPVPFWLIPAAARLYGVSTDYLHGESDYPDRDPTVVQHAAVVRSVRTLMMANADAVAEQILKVQAAHGPSSLQLVGIAQKALDLQEDFRVLRENNRKFDTDIRGGSRIVMLIDALAELARAAIKTENRRSESVNAIAHVRLERGAGAQTSMFPHPPSPEEQQALPLLGI